MRCDWGETSDKLYQDYHDHEWGKLDLDERYLYEKLILDSFQAGLSWATILHKRQAFRRAFDNFDVEKVALYDAKKITELMNNKDIVRNKRKIEAAINNAQVLVKWHSESKSLASFLQEYIPEPIINYPQKMSDIPAQTNLSQKISKELKKAGFKFVGPVIIYSFLQAAGFINDHLEKCDYKY